MIRDDRGWDSGILSEIGMTIATGALLLIVLGFMYNTLGSNATVALQSATSKIGGDIYTVASYPVPFTRSETYGIGGVNVFITSDHIIACDQEGHQFIKPMTTRVFPGNYSAGGTTLWNNTTEFREYLNLAFGGQGTKEKPVDENFSASLSGLMYNASLRTLADPIVVDQSRPLIVEKLYVYTMNNTTFVWGCQSYVFVYQ
jgi:hypothetical protein